MSNTDDLKKNYMRNKKAKWQLQEMEIFVTSLKSQIYNY